MKRNTRLTVLAFMLFLSLFFVLPQIEAGWWNTDTPKCRTKGGEDDGLCLATETAAIVDAAMTELTAGLVGDVEGRTREAGSDPNARYVIESNNGSLLAKSDRMLMAMYQNAPASSTEGFADLGRTFGLLPKVAYAQGPGIGFSGLAPLLPIWKVFRNIAYFLIAVIMVVVGFMVMFRKKIDPKTVVTVQNALPGIIVTLLLITFSYAIVGILIDLMYLSMALILSLLVPVGNSLAPGTFDDQTAAKYLNAHWWNAIAMIFNAGLRTTDDILGFMGFWGAVSAAAGSALLGVIGGGIIASMFTLTGGAAALAAVGAAALPILIVALALIFAIFRLLFTLLTAYINIIISLLTAPLQLLMGAIPGNNTFNAWFMNLVANLAAFPITAAFLLIATMLARYEVLLAAPEDVSRGIWAPPFVGGSAQGVSGLIALGILFTIPTIVNGVKESLKAKPPVAAGPGAILGPIGSGLGTGVQILYQGAFIRQAFGSKPPPGPVATAARGAERGTKTLTDIASGEQG